MPLNIGADHRFISRLCSDSLEVNTIELYGSPNTPYVDNGVSQIYAGASSQLYHKMGVLKIHSSQMKDGGQYLFITIPPDTFMS